MKKIVLAAALCSNLLMADITDFKKGFEAAIESFRLQVKLNNIVPQKIEFTSDNVLYIDIKNLDTASLLLLQYMAENEDFKDIKLGKNKIFLGSYSRNADVLFYKEKAEELFGEKVLIGKKQDLLNEYTNPLFLEDIYNYLLTQTNESGVVVIKEPIYIYEKLKEKQNKRYWKDTKTYWASKYFTLVNDKAQAYYLPDGWQNGNYKDSSNFKELEVKATDEQFKYARTLRANDGKVFVKVYKQNVYFLREDIKY
jgi:hypothetical protein